MPRPWPEVDGVSYEEQLAQIAKVHKKWRDDFEFRQDMLEIIRDAQRKQKKEIDEAEEVDPID